MFYNYLKSENKDLKLLIEYAKRLGNGAVFKRLGFLLERFALDQTSFINDCKALLTTGNVKFYPTLESDKLITRWRLWVPESWANPERRLTSSNGTREK